MNDKIEVVFNFDTTGSIYPVLDQVRRNLEDAIGTLFKEIPNLRIGIGANGDYGDLSYSGYDTKNINLTTDLYDLTQFIRNTNKTLGFGNGGECYELVLHRARTVYDWSLNSKKILVMIGDENPHTPFYHENKQKLNWRDEADQLASMGVQIYSVQCLSRSEANSYYQELAQRGNGLHLHLDQFSDILQLIKGIVYRQISTERVEQYEKTISASVMNRTLDKSFSVLSGRARDSRGRFVAVRPDLIPVDPGRFQMFNVEQETPIRDFVSDRNISFTPGKGFYEYLKAEHISEKKEIVIRDKSTGDMFTSDLARKILEIPVMTKNQKLVPKNKDKYDVFVQSTSFNRKLKAGTRFLYEVDMTQ